MIKYNDNYKLNNKIKLYNYINKKLYNYII